MNFKSLLGRWFAPAAVAAIASFSTPAQAETVYGITSDSNLVVFTTNDTSSVTLTAITGLQAGETIKGIDLQPQTGDLFAIGSTTRLYKIEPTTANAVQVGTHTFDTLVTSATEERFGVDFDPVRDNLKVVTVNEENLMLDPYGVNPPVVETVLNPPGTIVDIAYDRSFPGTDATQLYGIDADSNELVTISPTATITSVGPLGVDIQTSSSIDYHGTSLYAILNVGGESQLHLINPVNGAATLIGAINVEIDIISMAVLPDSLVVAGKKGPVPPKVKIKLNFAKPLADSISVSGALSVPDNFSVAGQEVTVDVGGVSRTFTLDVKGKAKVGFDSFSLKVKAKKINGVPTVLAQDAKFKLSLKKGDFADELDDEGLVNATVSGALVEVPISVNLDQHFYQTPMPLVYKATQDKKGQAK